MRELRLTTPAWVYRSEPTLGRVKELAFHWYPDAVLLELPVRTGRNEGELKSPTASIAPEATLPGRTGSHSSQVQNGVKGVPDFTKKFVEVCQPPTKASTNLEDEERK